MEAELVRLEKSGVIEKVQFSEWAAPVVPNLEAWWEYPLVWRLQVDHQPCSHRGPLPTSED